MMKSNSHFNSTNEKLADVLHQIAELEIAKKRMLGNYGLWEKHNRLFTNIYASKQQLQLENKKETHKAFPSNSSTTF